MERNYLRSTVAEALIFWQLFIEKLHEFQRSSYDSKIRTRALVVIVLITT